MKYCQCPHFKANIEILPINYKQVVFCQSADGSWNETILKFMIYAKSYAQFMTMQEDRDIKRLSQEVILTLVGIKLLNDKFPANQIEWNLVAGKAVSFLKKSFGGELPLPLGQLLEKLVIASYL